MTSQSTTVALVLWGAVGFAACGHSGAASTNRQPAKGYPAPAPTQTVMVPAPAPLPPPPPSQDMAPPPSGVTVTVARPLQDMAPPPSAVVKPQPLTSADRPMALAGETLRFSIRGVDRADVLWMRSGPGPKNPVVGQIPPDATGVVGTGAREKVGPGEWREVTYTGVRGWVNARFLIEESR
jgi:hypothetical protein